MTKFSAVLLFIFFSASAMYLNAQAQKAYVNMPDDLIEGIGKKITIPVEVNTGNIIVHSMNMKISYNPEILMIDSVGTEGTIGAGAICNAIKGAVFIGFIDLKGIKGKGTLLYLKGRTLAKGTSDITFVEGSCVYNNNLSYNILKQGKIRVVDSLIQPPSWNGTGAAFMTNVALKEGNIHTFTYKAAAPAGTQLKYSVAVKKNKKAVKINWITIDQETGTLTIDPPGGSAGLYAITVAAEDGINKSVLSPVAELKVTRNPALKKK